MKKIWTLTPALALAAVFFLAPEVWALEATELIPVGDTVGIEIKMEGVLVVESGEIDCVSGKAAPARSAGMLPGDLIISVNGRAVSTAAEFLSAAQSFDGSPVNIMARRGERDVSFTVTPAQTAEGGWQLGLWLRDGLSGIGTVTFYDPQSGCYGALGHGINDLKSGELMPVGKGSILEAEVSEVVRGQEGAPGELRGRIHKAAVLGSLESNNICGIFGHASGESFGKAQPIPVGRSEEIVLGQATILANVVGEVTKEYGVEICRVYRDENDVRSMMIRITDPELLSATGGIVQGMSGSPIIQDGKLVGAVTHVLVNDPTRGYGIFIENMLEAAG